MKKNLPALRRPRHPTEGHNEGPRCPRGQASLHLNKRQGWRKEQNLAGLQSCYLLGRTRRTRPDRGRRLLKKPSRLNNQEHKHLKNTFIFPCFHHQKTWEPPQVFVSKSKRIFSTTGAWRVSFARNCSFHFQISTPFGLTASTFQR